MRQHINSQSFDALPEQLDRQIDRILLNHAVPGAIVAVQYRDQSMVKIHGVTDIKSNRPVSTSTAFDVGSCSKAYAATAIALLIQDGKIGWDEPVHSILPELELYDDWITRHITYRDLLTNRTGIARQLPLESFANETLSVHAILKRLKHAKPIAPFRSAYGYWNPGFMAAAAAVARISNRSYEEFLSERLFQPLAMTGSASGALVDNLSDVAQGHALFDECATVFDEGRYPNYQGAAGVCSNALDAIQWLKFQLGEFPEILQPAHLAELHLPRTIMKRADRKLIHAPVESDICAYCMGWTRSILNGDVLIQHAGEMFGWRAHVAFLPDRNIGVAAYINIDQPAHHTICYTVLEALLLGQSRDWITAVREDRRRSSDAMHQAIESAMPTEPARPPSIALSELAGEYHHAAQGVFSVTIQETGLKLEMRDGSIWDADLNHLGGDVFELDFCHIAVRPFAPVKPRIVFNIENGKVRSLTDIFGEEFLKRD